MATMRMVRLGIVADIRIPAPMLAALAPLVVSARIDELWLSGSPPTGPVPKTVATSITASADRLGLAVSKDADVAIWTGGQLPKGAERRVVVPSFPERSLMELLGAWQRAGGALDRLVVELPVSIGRTRAEAEARSTGWFADLGLPVEQGLFGTLEDCQEEVAILCAKGVCALRFVLPATDVPDVIAQLSAVGIGSIATHGPGTEHSPAPPPPAGWGSPTRHVVAAEVQNKPSSPAVESDLGRKRSREKD